MWDPFLGRVVAKWFSCAVVQASQSVFSNTTRIQVTKVMQKNKILNRIQNQDTTQKGATEVILGPIGIPVTPCDAYINQSESHDIFFVWLHRKESSKQQIVVPVGGIPYQMSTYQLTEENKDFSYRDKRHQSSMVTSIGPQWVNNDCMGDGVGFAKREGRGWAYVWVKDLLWNNIILKVYLVVQIYLFPSSKPFLSLQCFDKVVLRRQIYFGAGKYFSVAFV